MADDDAADDAAPADGRRPPSPKATAPRPRPPTCDKEARLAAALRANLRRRKAAEEEGT